ncbi:MAG: hypothetical protein IT379_19005 [Deltaproteobacteria bacterium]|nr:hypothetical protein [Deltaproteobacteria bacterium]
MLLVHGSYEHADGWWIAPQVIDQHGRVDQPPRHGSPSIVELRQTGASASSLHPLLTVHSPSTLPRASRGQDRAAIASLEGFCK